VKAEALPVLGGVVEIPDHDDGVIDPMRFLSATLLFPGRTGILS